jgi:hypothetical protein
MAATTCSQCRRVNPPDAAFCYFDGTLLNGHGTTGRVTAGRQPFAHPLVFPSGRQCRSFDELALACHEEWDEARTMLWQGYFERFLNGLGRADLARAAGDAARAPDPDRGLDDLLDKLPTDVLQPPWLQVGTTEINLGTVAAGTDRRFELRLSNRGMRMLRGSITCDDTPWLSLGDGAGTQQKLFQCIGPIVVPVHVVGHRLRAGNRPLEGRLVVESNGGSCVITVTVAVPIRPFPDGVLRGAETPRQVAEKAKAAPQEAAVLFENGAVDRWYRDNGWVYPVQGPPASGVGAVQQFFEALGLTAPPRVEISTRAINLTGAAGDCLDCLIQVTTAERRPVYAHGTSDQPWLRVGRTNLQGRVATIPIIVPEVPDRPGEGLQGLVTITANGNQRFPVTVTLAVAQGSQARDQAAAFELLPPEPAPRPVAIPVHPQPSRPARAAVDGRPAPPPPPREKRTTSVWTHLVPLGLLVLALLGVLGVDALRDRPAPPEPPPVVIDDSIDPVPLIAVKFHDAEEVVSLSSAGNVKPGEGDASASDVIKAYWEPSMRFGVLMVRDGDSSRGASKKLTFQENGGTNNTVVLLDGQAPKLPGAGRGWLFGERAFRRVDNRSRVGPDWHGHWKNGERDILLPPDPRKGPGHKSVWLYDAEKIAVTQIVEVVAGEQSRKLDTCLVRYVIENNDTSEHRVGLRFMLDTFIGSNDGVPFTIPGEKELCDTMKEFRTPEEVPDFIQALERESLTEPGTVAQLQLRLGGRRIEAPQRVTLGAWPNPDLARPPYNAKGARQDQTLWDVPVLPIKALKPGDSCVTMYWNERVLKPGESREVGFAYGLGNVASDKDAAGRLGLSVGGNFKPGGEFTLTALVSNPQRNETLALDLPAGFELVSGEATQKVPEVPTEATRRTSPVTWKVKAGGDGSYTLTVKSSTGAVQVQPVRIRSSSIFD